jgi:hypothetical protein
VTQPAREREQSAEDLWQLLIVGERTESQRSHENDAGSKLDAIGELNGEKRSLAETICPQQIDEIGGREVKVDVLETQQGHE